jgi:hypothetical protein
MSPGAGNIVNYMHPDRMHILQKEPTQMSLDDWEIFMEAFKSWPLHPTACYIPSHNRHAVVLTVDQDSTLQESVKMTDKRI